jgi:hypothetical protein
VSFDDNVLFARVIEEGESAIERYQSLGLNTSDPAVAAEYGQNIVDQLRAVRLDAMADDLAQDVDDLRAFGRAGFEVIDARSWAEGLR